ncbi:MAG: RNA-binding S4 domain-containing protein [Erysipelotrichaceae bacterium]|nr:RNA-binding S4 domain-containing protein [Erysipelotrichaceae bacterium]
MRIDKYLKVARILKRRVVAKELAENGRLFLNGRAAKASSEVKPGDHIRILFGHREIEIAVLEIREQVSKQEALSLYEVIEEKKILEV